MLDLGFEASVLLLRELELKIDNLLLLAKIRDDAPQFVELV
jgi:hypothetical protein